MQFPVHQFPWNSTACARRALVGVWFALAISVHSTPSWALDCQQVHITLNSQAEVDSFQATYGSGGTCDHVLASLRIEGADITNLQGLSAITHIEGSLMIYTNPQLVDLKGLENLVAVKESIHIGENQSLKNLDGLSALQSSGHFTNNEFQYFWIRGNPVLENVDALENFTFARTYLWIRDNPSLKNLDGFQNLRSALELVVSRNASLESLNGLSSMTAAHLGLVITDNPKLPNLDGLEGFQEVNGNLSIVRNASLANIQALGSMRGVGSAVYVYENSSLSDCSPLKALLDGVDDPPAGPGTGSSGIPDVGQLALIRLNGHGCNSIGQIIDDIDSQACGDGETDIRLESQAAVDNFQSDFGPCDGVEKALVITGEDIEDLSPLGGVREVGGTLSIFENPELSTLEGLGAVERVHTLVVSDNPRLKNLEGLSSLRVIDDDMQVSENDQLLNFTGLDALQEITHGLWVRSNPALQSLSGLEGARILHSDLVRIESNDSLMNLEGMPLLMELDRLEVIENDSMIDLQGLQVNQPKQARLISIQSNTSLADLQGLEWLEEADVVELYNNPKLARLTGLDQLREVNALDIYLINSLKNLQGLGSLRHVGDFHDDENLASRLWIQHNAELISLEGMDELEDVSTLVVLDNPNLADCSALQRVLDVLDHGSPGPGPGAQLPHAPDLLKELRVENNATGCESTDALVPILPPVERVMTGSWYEPETAGQGFMIHAAKEHETGPLQVQNGLAVGYFYGYGPDGERFWLIGVHQGDMQWDAPIKFTATHVSGGDFDDFNAAAVVESEWGSFEFTPAHCGAGVLTMKGIFAGETSESTMTLNVSRLGAVSGSFCSEQIWQDESDSVTGSWYDPATPGQGFAFHKIADDAGVAYFYGFDDAGEPLWLIGVWDSPLEIGEDLQLDMLRVTGGTFDEVDPHDIIEEEWGQLTLRLLTCSTAEAVLTGQDGEQTLAMVQLAGSVDLECP